MKGKLLVELDAIMDTRLGLIDLLDPQAVNRAFTNPAYYKRNVDRFEPLCGVSDALFAQAWKDRTTEVLKHAMATPSLDFVHLGAIRLERSAMDDPTLDGVTVHVNIYPYAMSIEERSVLAQALSETIGLKATIELVRLPMEALTVTHCRDYLGMVLYNYHDWFALHGEELLKRGMPGVTMVVPKLYKDKPIARSELVYDGFGLIDPFRDSSLPMLEYLALEFADIRHFCVALPFDVFADSE